MSPIARPLHYILTLTRPLQHAILGPADCLYPMYCTDYALHQLQTQPVPLALWLIVKRVGNCNPLTHGFKSFLSWASSPNPGKGMPTHPSAL